MHFFTSAITYFVFLFRAFFSVNNLKASQICQLLFTVLSVANEVITADPRYVSGQVLLPPAKQIV